MRALLPLVAAAALSAGCDPGTSERWDLREVRVLGVRAEPPEVAPGDGVELRALVVDPLGAGSREVQLAWGVCTPDPAVGEASCAEPGRTLPLGLGSSSNLTVPSDALAGLSPEAALYGIDLYVVVAAQAPAVADGPGEDGEVAFKRVRVSTDPLPNRNPALAWFAPASPPEPGETTLLQAAATIESVQSFQGPLGPDEERLRFSWFTTAGVLERGVTLGESSPHASDLEWEAELPATLYVVLRDGRGGLDWAARELE